MVATAAAAGTPSSPKAIHTWVASPADSRVAEVVEPGAGGTDSDSTEDHTAAVEVKVKEGQLVEGAEMMGAVVVKGDRSVACGARKCHIAEAEAKVGVVAWVVRVARVAPGEVRAKESRAVDMDMVAAVARAAAMVATAVIAVAVAEAYAAPYNISIRRQAAVLVAAVKVGVDFVVAAKRVDSMAEGEVVAETVADHAAATKVEALTAEEEWAVAASAGALVTVNREVVAPADEMGAADLVVAMEAVVAVETMAMAMGLRAAWAAKTVDR